MGVELDGSWVQWGLSRLHVSGTWDRPFCSRYVLYTLMNAEYNKSLRFCFGLHLEEFACHEDSSSRRGANDECIVPTPYKCVLWAKVKRGQVVIFRRKHAWSLCTCSLSLPNVVLMNLQKDPAAAAQQLLEFRGQVRANTDTHAQLCATCS